MHYWGTGSVYRRLKGRIPGENDICEKKKPETYFKRSSNVIPEVFQPETIL